MADIASHKQRLDGVIVAAGINHVANALDYSDSDIQRIIDTNYKGVFYSATAAGRQMLEHKTRGSILLIASMSGLIANKGMNSSIYNSSKAAVIQLGRSLAMEWAKVDPQGRGGIRVNTLCPGHIVTPMAQMVIDQDPATKEIWESENMMGRLSKPEEFRGLALLLMSEASSFMTGSTTVCDGGHTAW
ncbi:short-chain dehydrogenase [Aspergillus homomorphus CBS 101889]|uniref:Short-chain dehydrogenase n=1 Tax=Aspergillus homomorphus (strain CBS 101889) TaxID=1450537 RepID=A0A395HXT0_ASPHC|nr:short-chain dehydrogenase [Aspergillus homomorphus CBS 101889]RAL12590.1 short-chain dehydrogenase [Aspergillus homomorphus CBS 101889]